MHQKSFIVLVNSIDWMQLLPQKVRGGRHDIQKNDTYQNAIQQIDT